MVAAPIKNVDQTDGVENKYQERDSSNEHISFNLLDDARNVSKFPTNCLASKNASTIMNGGKDSIVMSGSSPFSAEQRGKIATGAPSELSAVGGNSRPSIMAPSSFSMTVEQQIKMRAEMDKSQSEGPDLCTITQDSASMMIEEEHKKYETPDVTERSAAGSARSNKEGPIDIHK